jgi:hypothetical protein
VKLRKVIRRKLRHEGKDVTAAGDVNAAVAANLNEPGPSRTHVSTRQRVVQRSGSRKRDKPASGQ